MAKKKTSYIQKKHKNEANKKAIVWLASAIGAIIITMTLLLILNQQ